MNTKEKITNSLTTLMKTDQFENITVKEICENASVNRSTYYRNFKSKEDIIKYKLKIILNEYIQTFEKQENKNKENYIYIILSTFLKYKKFFTTIHKQNQSYILQKALTEYFKKSLKTQNKEQLYKYYYHIGGIYNFTICWIENGMEDDIDKLTKIGAQITKDTTPLYKIE